MMYSLAILLVAALPAIWLIKWATNYWKARQLGLPILLLQVSYEDAWWLPLRPLFAWVEKLPLGLGGWYTYTEMGWTTVDGRKTTMELGENFILCSPSTIQIVTAYAPAINQTCRDFDTWEVPAAQSQVFTFFGQNVTSTKGAEWRRHRKIVASAFNERTMDAVWNEANEQARFLTLSDSLFTLGDLRSTFDLVAMQVLAIVGFGQQAELTGVKHGHRLSFMDSLGFILKNIILTVLFNGLKAPDWALPSSLKRLKLSVAEFRLYMQELVHTELRDKSSSKTLLSSMVSANEAEKDDSQSRRSYLSESELYGNLFVFNLAGYETTASSLAFALPYIAAYPEVQDWMREEVDAVYKEDGVYSELYPRLVRCLAWMYEVMRLASPAPLLTRTPRSPQVLPIVTATGTDTITVNPGVQVGWQLYGGHLSPRWGADVLEFKPQRFLVKSPEGVETEMPITTYAFRNPRPEPPVPLNSPNQGFMMDQLPCDGV